MRSSTIAAGLFALFTSYALAQDMSGPALSPSSSSPVASDAPPLSSEGRLALLNRMSGGIMLERYLTALRNEFARQDADGNGTLDEADLDLHVKVAEANTRLMFVMQIMPSDLDGDGFVTEDELRRKLQYEQRRNSIRQTNAQQQERFEENIRRLMLADTDKDGRISIKEAMDFFRTQPNFAQQSQSARLMARQMLALAPEGKTSLALTDAETMAASYFRSVDTDGNGTISIDEIEAERRTTPPPPPPIQAGCEIPKASATAKVVLLSAYEAQSLSTVALGSQNDVTGVGNVVVEPGTEPLYIVIASFTSNIWRFYGALDRVERVVVTGTQASRLNGEAGRNAAGVTGLPPDKITFPARVGCIRYFSNVPSTDAAQIAGLVRTMTGKNPETVAAKYAVLAFNVPSGKIDSLGNARQAGLTIVQNGLAYTLRDGKMSVTKPDQSLASDLDLYSPGGVVAVDAKSVVASVPTEPYEVLPRQAGLLQLVDSGAISRNGSEFLINRKIRIPAGLHGGHSVKFLLRRGVPDPDGDFGHSTVISEETGAQVRPHK